MPRCSAGRRPAQHADRDRLKSSETIGRREFVLRDHAIGDVGISFEGACHAGDGRNQQILAAAAIGCERSEISGVRSGRRRPEHLGNARRFRVVAWSSPSHDVRRRSVPGRFDSVLCVSVARASTVVRLKRDTTYDQTVRISSTTQPRAIASIRNWSVRSSSPRAEPSQTMSARLRAPVVVARRSASSRIARLVAAKA